MGKTVAAFGRGVGWGKGWDRKYCEGLLMVALMTDTATEAWRPASLPWGEASAPKAWRAELTTPPVGAAPWMAPLLSASCEPSCEAFEY